MVKFKKIRVLSLAKLQAIIMGVVGLIAGILYSFGGLIIDILVTVGWVSTTETPGLSFGTILAFGALFVMPIIAAIFGFVVGAIGAIIYNLFSKVVGGIGIDFEQKV